MDIYAGEHYRFSYDILQCLVCIFLFGLVFLLGNPSVPRVLLSLVVS